jgi:hypothetical protein
MPKASSLFFFDQIKVYFIDSFAAVGDLEQVISRSHHRQPAGQISMRQQLLIIGFFVAAP